MKILSVNEMREARLKGKTLETDKILGSVTHLVVREFAEELANELGVHIKIYLAKGPGIRDYKSLVLEDLEGNRYLDIKFV
ncbi:MULTISPECIES: hypothetical protein [Pontibacillus]|uniref:Uncharacterized protein n=1 Tax=Pontibacillus chungwhensis TaxID=265426 RepID=A0ABY8V5N5_9BACI|nr:MULTISPECIES: hypothetical protein [Pontibacillus]MCD5326163.1 hypothetical protein [Pontibacillus sp. HN14]WIG00322.1 hypothetical protein QNI29_20965 [Pontibacillus chungwhensis]